MPNARKAYSVGRTSPRSLVDPAESRQAIAPAASPANVEIVRDPGATSSRAPHFGHSMSFVRAADSGAEISVLQCGQMRTATVHLTVQTPYSNRSDAPMKRGDEIRKRLTASCDESPPSRGPRKYGKYRRHGAAGYACDKPSFPSVPHDASGDRMIPSRCISGAREKILNYME